MAQKTPVPDGISEKLQEAIDGLRKDVTRVEVWATALSSFVKPVPDYRPDQKYELGQPVKTGKLVENDGPEQRRSAQEKDSE